MDKLSSLGAEIAYYDSHIPVIGPTREHSAWEGCKSIAWDEATIRGFDAAIVVTAHSSVDYQQLAHWSGCLVDTRNVFTAENQEDNNIQNIWKA
jgi:UDP-N-acetyl-D-glucosamine dehydrogenase